MTTKEQHQGDLKVTKWYYILIEVVVTIIYPHVAKWHRIMQSIFVISSVHFSRSVVCDYMWPHAARQLPCPSPTPVLCSKSWPSSRWCHPTISSSVFPFSSCLLSFPGSGSFSMSQYFASGDQSIGVSALASVLPMNNQDWSPLGWTGWISLQSKGLSRVFSNTTVQKHQLLGSDFLYSLNITSLHDYWKNHSFDQTDYCWQSNVSAFSYAV